jgi:hypothetical protein
VKFETRRKKMNSLRLNLFALAVLALAITPSLAFGQSNTGTQGCCDLLDPNYTLVSAPAGVPLGPVYSTPTDGAWVAPSLGSNWINPYGSLQSAPGGNYDYQSKFTASSTVNIQGGFAADNSACLYVNTIKQVCTVGGIYGFKVYTWFSFPVVTGTRYTIDFVVNNISGPTGLEVELAPPTVLCQLTGAVYNDGLPNATLGAWPINFGFVTSDSFQWPGGPPVTGVCFYAWLYPGDTLISTEMSITSSENGGTFYFDQTVPLTCALSCTGNLPIGPFNGFAPPNRVCGGSLQSNPSGPGFNVYACTASTNVSLAAGTYWLNLQNAFVNDGDPAFWDQNDGIGCPSPTCPSSASETAVGPIQPESFVIY